MQSTLILMPGPQDFGLAARQGLHHHDVGQDWELTDPELGEVDFGE